jgi:predicted nicotinamide N-methyase
MEGPGRGGAHAVASPPSFGRFGSSVRRLPVGRRWIDLLEVSDLATHVDRAALLREANPAEPPYWACVWTGAVVLAGHVDAAVSCAGRRVLDLGCGLGLVGIVAALGGGQVTFFDRVPEAPAFAVASARRNRCPPVLAVAGDFACDPLRARFDLILAAEVLYDAESFVPLVGFLGRHLAPGGTIVLADAHRTPTAPFYAALAAAGFTARVGTVRMREERLPLAVDLVTVQHRSDGGRRRDGARG